MIRVVENQNNEHIHGSTPGTRRKFQSNQPMHFALTIPDETAVTPSRTERNLCIEENEKEDENESDTSSTASKSFTSLSTESNLSNSSINIKVRSDRRRGRKRASVLDTPTTCAYSWLWNKKTLQDLCDKVKNNEAMSYFNGKYFVDVRWNGGYKLVLLKRDAYTELWDAIDEFNHRANRRCKDSPIPTTRNKNLPLDANTVCGWYTNRNYLVTGSAGVGKTSFLLYTLIKRIRANQPTIIQSGTSPAKAFLIHNQEARELDTTLGERDIIERYYRLNRKVWVLFDHSHPLPALTNKNWVKVYACRSGVKLQHDMFVRVCGGDRPVPLHMDTWSLDEVSYTGKHLLGYTEQQLQHALLTYQCFDPTAALALRAPLLKDDKLWKSKIVEMRGWLPNEIEAKLTTGCSVQNAFIDSQTFSGASGCQLMVQRPNTSTLGYKYIGLSASCYVSTRYIADSIVATAFSLKQPDLVGTWVRELACEPATDAGSADKLMLALIHRKLKSGGRYFITGKDTNKRAKSVILGSSGLGMPENFKKLKLQLGNQNSPEYCESRYLDKFMVSRQDTCGELNIAIINETTGPRLLVFNIVATGTNSSNKIHADDLAQLWHQVPAEARNKRPYIVNVTVNSGFQSFNNNWTEENEKGGSVPDSDCESLVSSIQSSEKVNVSDLYDQYDMVLDQDELYTNSFGWGLRMALWGKRVFRQTRILLD